MAISDKMLARGEAVGLSPRDDESSKSFGARVRKAESAANEKPAPSVAGGGWRRF
jgi:hypothetical protein